MDPQSAKKGGEIGDRGGISPLSPPLYDTLHVQYVLVNHVTYVIHVYCSKNNVDNHAFCNLSSIACPGEVSYRRRSEQGGLGHLAEPAHPVVYHDPLYAGLQLYHEGVLCNCTGRSAL